MATTSSTMPQFNPELGGEAGFERLSAALRQHDLGLILDFVPNHIGVHFADNPWWLDVLEWGPASPHAASFDIDWEQLPYRARGGVLLPIIGSSYGQALENGDIELRYDARKELFGVVFRASAADRAGALRRNPAHDRQGGGRGGYRAGKAILALASRHQGPRHPSRKEAPAFKTELKAIAGAADIIARGLDAYRAGPGRPAPTLFAAPSAGAPALQARPLAACLQRHQLPPFFRRQYARGLARRGRRHL